MTARPSERPSAPVVRIVVHEGKTACSMHGDDGSVVLSKLEQKWKREADASKQFNDLWSAVGPSPARIVVLQVLKGGKRKAKKT